VAAGAKVAIRLCGTLLDAFALRELLLKIGRSGGGF